MSIFSTLDKILVPPDIRYAERKAGINYQDRSKIVGAVAIAAVSYYTGYTQGYQYSAALFSSAVQGRQQRRAMHKQRRQYLDAQKDRITMVERDARQARSIPLGRVRTVEGVRRWWESGEHKEYLTLCVSLAGCEIDAVEQYFLDDKAVTIDGSGYVQTAPWFKGRTESGGGYIFGPGTFELPATFVPGSVSVIAAAGSGEDRFEQQVSFTIAGTTITITDSVVATVLFTYTTGTSLVRIRTYLGTATQNIGADLAAEFPGNITSTDRAAGVAMAVMTMQFDQDVFPQGRPTLTALLRGAKLYDPRLDSTNGGSGSHRLATPSTWEWSENPALHVSHYARIVQRVPDSDIHWGDVIEAANACDVPTDFNLRMPGD